MTGWTPLHQRIVASSVWSTKYHVRIAWVTLLAITGKDGVAHVTVSGLARLANIKLEEAADALEVLSAPDPDTMTQDGNEGRRIARAETGWKLLNWDAYRVLAKKGLVQEQNREAQARWRDRNRVEGTPADGPAVIPPMARVRGSNRPTSVEEVIEAGKMLGMDGGACRKFWNHYEGTAKQDESGRVVWVTGERGEKQVGNWRNVLGTWKAREDEHRFPKGAHSRVSSGARKEADKEPGPVAQLTVQTFNQAGAVTPTSTP